jgi:hypothetical protein
MIAKRFSPGFPHTILLLACLSGMPGCGSNLPMSVGTQEGARPDDAKSVSHDPKVHEQCILINGRLYCY